MNARLTRSARRSRRGFSLIEICLALMIFALGILGIFALVPESLRQSRTAVRDSYMTQFAQCVLSGVRANAASVTNLTVWNQPAFHQWVVADIWPPVQAGTGLSTPLRDIEFPNTNSIDRTYIRYALLINPVGGTVRKEVTLFVDAGKYGPMRTNVFYTELYYMGNPSRLQ